MKELVEAIAKALVDKPDEVQVRAVESEQATVLEIRVNPGDLGNSRYGTFPFGFVDRSARSIFFKIGCAAGSTSRNRKPVASAVFSASSALA